MVAIALLVFVFIATNVVYLEAEKEAGKGSTYPIKNLGKNQKDVYTDSWAVEINDGGDEMAENYCKSTWIY